MDDDCDTRREEAGLVWPSLLVEALHSILSSAATSNADRDDDAATAPGHYLPK